MALGHWAVGPDASFLVVLSPGKWLLLATGILLFCMFLVLQDLVSSNRPHELENAPWVALITLLNLAPCTGALMGLIRYSREQSTGPGRGILFFLAALWLVVVEGLNILILVSAASCIPAVLGF